MRYQILAIAYGLLSCVLVAGVAVAFFKGARCNVQHRAPSTVTCTNSASGACFAAIRPFNQPTPIDGDFPECLVRGQSCGSGSPCCNTLACLNGKCIAPVEPPAPVAAPAPDLEVSDPSTPADPTLVQDLTAYDPVFVNGQYALGFPSFSPNQNGAYSMFDGMDFTTTYSPSINSFVFHNYDISGAWTAPSFESLIPLTTANSAQLANRSMLVTNAEGPRFPVDNWVDLLVQGRLIGAGGEIIVFGSVLSGSGVLAGSVDIYSRFCDDAGCA